MRLLDIAYLISLSNIFVLAAWSTQYTDTNDVAYLSLRNNKVLKVLKTDVKAIETLPDPPTNSTIVLGNENTLYAFYGTSFCKPIIIVQYSETDNKWVNVTLTGKTPNYLTQSIYMASPTSELIYIYGGRNMSESCQSPYISDPSTIYDNRISYVVSSEIKAFNTTSGSFIEIETASSPTSMFAAGVMRMTGSSSSLLIGGKAQNGWIGMNQLALWEYSSWTFISTSKSSFVDSRTNPLVLPLKSAAGNPKSTATNSTLVLGGRVNSHQSLPYAVGLDLDPDDGWTWNSDLNQTLISSSSDILGAVTFDNTLITISPKDLNKRDDDNVDYSIGYFDVSTWEEASSYSPTDTDEDADTATSESGTASATSTIHASSTATAEAKEESSQTMTTGGKIALSTVLPVGFMAIGAAAVAVFYYRKKRVKKDLLPAPRPLSLSPYLGSGSSYEHQMLNGEHSDSKSIKSWTEKRRLYDEHEKFQHQQQNQYGASISPQPYLSLRPSSVHTRENSDLGYISVGEGTTDPYDNPFYTVHEDMAPLTDMDQRAKPSRANTMRAASASLVNYFRGRRTASSATAPVTSMRSPSAMSMTQDISQIHFEDSLREAGITADDGDEFFNGRDVQVLVSSKRRSRLRVTNPDPDTPSRANSNHSTIASLNVRKQRAGRYAPLQNNYPMSSISRHNSITSMKSGPDEENDIVDAKVGTRAVSSGSTVGLRPESPL